MGFTLIAAPVFWLLALFHLTSPPFRPSPSTPEVYASKPVFKPILRAGLHPFEGTGTVEEVDNIHQRLGAAIERMRKARQS
jgi:hypothetical protein